MSGSSILGSSRGFTRRVLVAHTDLRCFFALAMALAKKRMVAKLKAIKVELRRRMHARPDEVGAWPRKVVHGY